jgi:hypothetical protein
MSNEQQTAVDLMFQKAMLVLPMGFIDARQALKETYQQAKEMEKEQIVKAFENGDWNYHYSRKTGNDFENGEEYFEELYGGNK